MFKSPEHFRSEFPIAKEWVYFNHASHGFYPQRTVTAIKHFADFGADPVAYDVDFNESLKRETRERVAQLANSNPDLVAFSSSLCESMNLFANGMSWQPGDNVLVAREEFPSVIYPWVNLRKRYGIEVRRVEKNSNGRTDLSLFQQAMDRRTRAIAISHVEWSDGYRNDIAALGEICRKQDIELFVDVTQSMGAQPIDVPGWGVSAVATHVYKWLLAGHGLGAMIFNEDAIDRIYPTYAGVHSFQTGIEDTHFSYDDTSQDIPFQPLAERYQTGGFDKLSMTALHSSLSLILEAEPVRSSKHGIELVDQIAEGAMAKGYRIVSDLSPEHRSQFLAITTSDTAADEAAVATLASRNVAVSLRPKGIRVSPYFYHTSDDVQLFLDALPENR